MNYYYYVKMDIIHLEIITLYYIRYYHYFVIIYPLNYNIFIFFFNHFITPLIYSINKAFSISVFATI